MNRSRCLGLASVLAALPAGCASADIVGEWESPEEVSYFGDTLAPNRMTIGSDNTGKADIHYILTDDPSQTPYLDRFEIDWEQKGDAFTLTMTCFDSDRLGENCDNQSFVMVCEDAPSEGTYDADFACVGDGLWESYSFLWK
jgi:hypothetical protein